MKKEMLGVMDEWWKESRAIDAFIPPPEQFPGAHVGVILRMVKI